jgi:hypothetical protein
MGKKDKDKDGEKDTPKGGIWIEVTPRPTPKGGKKGK